MKHKTEAEDSSKFYHTTLERMEAMERKRHRKLQALMQANALEEEAKMKQFECSRSQFNRDDIPSLIDRVEEVIKDKEERYEAARIEQARTKAAKEIEECTFKPRTSSQSSQLRRSLNDMFEWQKEVERKRLAKKLEFAQENDSKSKGAKKLDSKTLKAKVDSTIDRLYFRALDTIKLKNQDTHETKVSSRKSSRKPSITGQPKSLSHSIEDFSHLKQAKGFGPKPPAEPANQPGPPQVASMPAKDEPASPPQKLNPLPRRETVTNPESLISPIMASSMIQELLDTPELKNSGHPEIKIEKVEPSNPKQRDESVSKTKQAKAKPQYKEQNSLNEKSRKVANKPKKPKERSAEKTTKPQNPKTTDNDQRKVKGTKQQGGLLPLPNPPKDKKSTRLSSHSPPASPKRIDIDPPELDQTPERSKSRKSNNKPIEEKIKTGSGTPTTPKSKMKVKESTRESSRQPKERPMGKLYSENQLDALLQKRSSEEKRIPVIPSKTTPKSKPSDSKRGSSQKKKSSQQSPQSHDREKRSESTRKPSKSPINNLASRAKQSIQGQVDKDTRRRRSQRKRDLNQDKENPEGLKEISVEKIVKIVPTKQGEKMRKSRSPNHGSKNREETSGPQKERRSRNTRNQPTPEIALFESKEPDLNKSGSGTIINVSTLSDHQETDS